MKRIITSIMIMLSAGLANATSDTFAYPKGQFAGMGVYGLENAGTCGLVVNVPVAGAAGQWAVCSKCVNNACKCGLYFPAMDNGSNPVSFEFDASLNPKQGCNASQQPQGNNSCLAACIRQFPQAAATVPGWKQYAPRMQAAVPDAVKKFSFLPGYRE